MSKFFKIIGVAIVLALMSLVGTFLSHALVQGSVLLLGAWGPALILLIMLLGAAWFFVSISEDV